MKHGEDDIFLGKECVGSKRGPESKEYLLTRIHIYRGLSCRSTE